VPSDSSIQFPLDHALERGKLNHSKGRSGGVSAQHQNPCEVGGRPAFQFQGHHFDENGQLIHRTLLDPASEASTSQATFTSRAFSSIPGPQLTSSSNLSRSVSSYERFQNPRSLAGTTMPVDPRYPDMLMEPDSRPISQEQLAAEVKSIYAGLTMIDSKCINVDQAQAAAMRDAHKSKPEFATGHWQAQIDHLRNSLHEHHDCDLAWQHPSATPALRRLAGKYSNYDQETLRAEAVKLAYADYVMVDPGMPVYNRQGHHTAGSLLGAKT